MGSECYEGVPPSATKRRRRKEAIMTAVDSAPPSMTILFPPYHGCEVTGEALNQAYHHLCKDLCNGRRIDRKPRRRSLEISIAQLRVTSGCSQIWDNVGYKIPLKFLPSERVSKTKMKLQFTAFQSQKRRYMLCPRRQVHSHVAHRGHHSSRLKPFHRS